MPRFFVPEVTGDVITVEGDDASHIVRSLRMREGERLTVCDGQTDYDCVIESALPELVTLRCENRSPVASEPTVRVTLYQGFPKGDKLELVIQKAVELGVCEIVPVVTSRSVSRPDEKAATKRLARWQKQSEEAAKQSGRGIIPDVRPMTDFKTMLDMISRHERMIFCYESGGAPLGELLACRHADGSAGMPADVGLFIGPEGGISPSEAEQLEAHGAAAATLGRRILRTETAPIAALAAIMFATGNLQ